MPAEDAASDAMAPAGGRPPSAWLLAALLGATYFACAEAGTFLSVRGSTYVSFWLPAGLYVAVLLLSERRQWPALMLGAFAGNLLFDLSHGTSLVVALLFAIANLVQSAGGAWLMRRFVAERPTLATLREFVGFLAFAAALSPVAGATIGAATLVAFGLSDTFVESWKVWWGSNAMAILVLSPMLLTCFAGNAAELRRYAQPRRLLEAALILLTLGALVGYLLFRGQGVMSPNKGWIVLPVLWAGLRFGPLGAAATSFALAVPIAFFTTQFHSGLRPEQIAAGDYVFPMQSALALTALVTMIAAIVVYERDHKMLELSESEARLRLSVHASNIGLWDWDITGNHLYLSPEWKSQLGYRDHEIPHRFEEWRDRLHPEERVHMLPKVKAYLTNPRGNYEAEFRLRHRDGTYRWIYARAQLETAADGTPRRMLGCHIDITERKRAEEDLQQSLSRMQELLRRLAGVQEIERRNINRELHDRVGQNLSALNLSLSLIRSQIPDGALLPVCTRLDDARALLEATSRQVRDVMAELRPAALDDYGLLAALRHYCGAVASRLGISIAVTGKELDPRPPAATETALFRIAQEALNNIAKHARSSRVQVELVQTPGNVRLTVTDDGVGFAARNSPGGAPTYGIGTMHERAEAVGARLKIVSAPGAGTRVEVEAAAAP